jgi:hypothetical protein
MAFSRMGEPNQTGSRVCDKIPQDQGRELDGQSGRNMTTAAIVATRVNHVPRFVTRTEVVSFHTK